MAGWSPRESLLAAPGDLKQRLSPVAAAREGSTLRALHRSGGNAPGSTAPAVSALTRSTAQVAIMIEAFMEPSPAGRQPAQDDGPISRSAGRINHQAPCHPRRVAQRSHKRLGERRLRSSSRRHQTSDAPVAVSITRQG
jgi:hypothetical protein